MYDEDTGFNCLGVIPGCWEAYDSAWKAAVGWWHMSILFIVLTLRASS